MQTQKDYLCLPANQTWISAGYATTHTAEDYGWLSKNPASKNQSLVALSDAEVVSVFWAGDGGNVVVIGWEAAENTWYAEYQHCLDNSVLAVGSVVKQFDEVSKMGNTGKSNGEHVHLVLIKAPKGSAYNNSLLRKYRVKPSDYLYVFPGQEFIGEEVKPKPAVPYFQEGAETVYTVVKGDTLWGIGVKYGVDYLKIAKDNGIKNPALIHVGQELKIYASDAPATPVSNVGKYYNVEGKTTLYNLSGTAYPKTASAKRSMVIEAEVNSMYQITSASYSPKTVYVALGSNTITEKAKYRVG